MQYIENLFVKKSVNMKEASSYIPLDIWVILCLSNQIYVIWLVIAFTIHYRTLFCFVLFLTRISCKILTVPICVTQKCLFFLNLFLLYNASSFISRHLGCPAAHKRVPPPLLIQCYSDLDWVKKTVVSVAFSLM